MEIREKTMKIYGEDVTATVITDNAGTELVRLLVTGSWAGPQDLSKVTPNMLVETYGDDSFSISVQKLIPTSIAENEAALNETVDNVLNSIEDALGLDEDSLSSSSGYAGHSDTTWDGLMTEEEQNIIATLNGCDAQ